LVRFCRIAAKAMKVTSVSSFDFLEKILKNREKMVIENNNWDKFVQKHFFVEFKFKIPSSP
jgi:hypothetical protein